MKIILAFCLFAAALIVVALSHAVELVPPVYVPVGVYYENGTIENVKAFPEHIYDTREKCQEAVAAVLAHAQGGAVMKAACLPVPSTAQDPDAPKL